MNMQLQKEVISIQKQQAVKKCAAPKCQGEKRCEIKGGGSVIIVQWQNCNNDNSGEFGAES